MVKILFVHHVSSIGGGSYCLLSILKGLDRNKFLPVVLLKSEGDLVSEIKALGVDVIYFPQMATIPYNKSIFRLTSLLGYYRMLESFIFFSKLLKEHDFDIVYLNNMMLYPYLRMAKNYGCRTIIHIREHWPKNEHQIQFSIAKKNIYKYADHVIAINNYSSSMFPECKCKSSIIYDWVDFSDRYRKVDFNELFGEDASKLKVMLFTGGISEIKGTLEVVQTFTQNIKGSDYRLLIMGGSFDSPSSKILAFGERIKMAIGWLPYRIRVKHAIENDCRIVVIPPTYQIVDYIKKSYCMLSYFTIPHANLALAEAAILGLVTVAANTEESMEYANGGKGAILFEFNNIEDFISKIHYTIANYDVIKYQLKESSSVIAQMFEPSRNIMLLNKICEYVALGDDNSTNMILD